MMEEVKDKEQIFKKNSIILVIFEVIFIIVTFIIYLLRDISADFSMEKLFTFSLIFSIIFGVFVIGYILVGLLRYKIKNIPFTSKINYRILSMLIISLMIIGAICFFLDLVIVEGDMTEITWGGFILGTIGFVILGIGLVIGILKIAEEIKVQL
jgi:hypothetical protein